jgi:glycosyltransferase involved in cell wall biosynthesis
MRVVMLVRYFPYLGGAERQVQSLAPRLRARGVDVRIVSRQYDNLPRYEEMEGVPVYRLPMWGPKFLTSLLYSMLSLPLLRRLRPDVLHAHELLSPASTALLAKRSMNIPVAAKILRGGVLGDIDKLQGRRSGRMRLSLLKRDVDAFVVISQEIDQELAELGVEPERRAFIPNGVDTDRFVPVPLSEKKRLRTQLGISPDGPVAVFTGRLSEEKRVDQLLRVWKTVREQYSQASLLVVGSGTEEARLKQLAGPGVQFCGLVDDVVPYLQTADIFVLPSVTEGLSNALLEALSVGLPVVATRIGGTPDLVRHGENGYLIEPDNVDGLQSSLMMLLADEDMCSRLGQAGRGLVLENYSLDSTADRLVILYKKLAGDKK